ncbi:hypothetical protein Agub_g8784 [Astrephomene gubernaculifera]|uniref:Fe2OG dioxygenase domain-containing protein n=1 Tax=Astrephomene gubernaculifera TaxID=47775 RepID=A0AAD3DUA3_9CHLO|nr:hypothetical protein Agub_g8784 [Astrephomene gubernaculifera]
MGKTLAKARKKAAKLAEEQGQLSGAAQSALAVIAKRLKYKLPQNPKKKIKLVPIISEALNAKAWDDAQQLFDMLERKRQTPDAEIPKLGAVMRWVRVADLAGTEAISAKLLAAIMRVSGGPRPGLAASQAAPNAPEAAASSPETATDGSSYIPVRRFPPWRPEPAAISCTSSDTAPAAVLTSMPAATDSAAVDSKDLQSVAVSVAAAAAAASAADPSSSSSHVPQQPGNGSGCYAGRFAVVPLPAEYAGTNTNGSTAAAAAAAAAAASASNSTSAATLLPNLAKDLTMFCTEPGLIRFEANRPPVVRVEWPFVQGAFSLVGALSREECAQIVACAEEMGYTVDPDYTFSAAARAAAMGGLGLSAGSAARNGGSGGGERGAAGVVWLADETLQGPLYERVAHLLPQNLCGGALAGINARWRLYRYDKGAVYRPHVDGAWPGSGLKNGRYEFDAYGDRWSRLTFLVYLNDDFEGGATTFYTPAPAGSGACLEAHSVKPVAGNISVFPHGDTLGSLVHEGAAVTRGSKYVIRTEVLYKLAPGVKSGGAGAPQPAMQLPVKSKT